MSALVKTEEGLEEEKNSLPTDQKRKPVSANPPRMTRIYVVSFPACTTEWDIIRWTGQTLYDSDAVVVTTDDIL